MIRPCRRRLLELSLLLAACGDSHHVAFDSIDGGRDAAQAGDVYIAEELPDCDDDTSRIPDSLACTGLFESLGKKRVQKSVIAFTPAAPLWSDGAAKDRWIALPEGTQIDNAQPNDWVFPVGTKLWKEFRVDGKRIETRFFWKVRSDRWLRGTYAWNDDESEALTSLGGNIEIANGTYHLPTGEECDDCHKGQGDRVLGFSAVNLGLAGAGGITLSQLAERGWLSERPSLTELSIGADETGIEPDGIPLAAKALGILHTNCGLPCHNNTPGAKANLTSQNLRLDSTLMDGRKPDATFNALRTALGKRAEGVQWDNHPFRILPGDPDNSLIIQLMSHRDPTGMGRGQMPPIGSAKVDTESVATLRKWISLLKGGATPDAGAGMDAGASDAGGGPDAATDAASVPPMDAAGSPIDAASDAGDAASPVDAGTDAGLDAGSALLDADSPDSAGDASLGSDAGEGGLVSASDAG